jgi:hypothetical protein
MPIEETLSELFHTDLFCVLEAGLGICLAWYKQTTVSSLCYSILGTRLTACSLALVQCSCSTKELAKPLM